ncbi:hypothetical protein MVEG_12373 [Podila verticillata NRRL 6337]|uniref:Heterokaryon incompatibility domain-containing protein n=1 Tax=Podila verticillata NRRL 6337 TaxID=1069443 RepID=A0A086TIL3_9FUNG|nr:hypothetical protein MVEG_12373 [Podila verticillata NRRL 6337]
MSWFCAIQIIYSNMALIPPKRLFHVPSMSTVMYVDVADDVKEKGYVAISHVWGKQQMYSADEVGILGGVNWRIPLSNTNKISRLISAMKYREMEYCWFDVLCMPQDKQDEINLEIPFMGDYYSEASVTFVLSDEKYVINKDFTTWSDFMSDVIRSDRELTADETRWIVKNPNLLNFGKDLWFTRVWTLQEAVLSKKLILVDTGGSYLDLSNLLDKMWHMSLKNVPMVFALFEEPQFLVEIANTLHEYRSGELCLTRALGTSRNKNCHEIRDRFYAVLGMLDYKDFVVDYEMDIDDLNKRIAQHAYSKGDISWLAVGGNAGKGFVQPMHQPFLRIGHIWKQDTSSIVFNDMLCVQAKTFGTVACCEEYIGPLPDIEENISWTVRTFTKWGFGLTQILDAMLRYNSASEEFVSVGTHIIDALSKGASFQSICREIAQLQSVEYVYKYAGDVLAKLTWLGTIYKKVVIINVVTPTGNYPLIVCGNAEVGDTVVVTKLYDDVYRKRGLGIVVSKSSERKGVCIVPREIVGYKFDDIHKFVV